VTLIDTGAAVARQTARVLDSGAVSDETSDKSPRTAGRITYYSSGDVASAQRVIGVLMQREVESVRPLPI
jgi:hypothetical protein